MKYIKKKSIKLLIILFIIILVSPLLLSFKNEESNNYYKNIPDISTLSKSDLNLPSSYDLRDVNGINYTTPLKNQEDLGLCWAFSSTTAFESALKKSNYVDNNFNEWFSPYQIDALVTKGVKRPDINYVTETSRSLGDGASGPLALKAFTTAYSPILYSKFNKNFYLEYYKKISKYKFDANDIYDERSSEYYVSDFDMLYNEYETIDKINDLSTQDVIKYYIYNYGGVIVSTVSPSNFCDDYYSDCYMNASNISINDEDGFHAMAVIGWDDNKKSWILQNSWGNILSYIYLSYDSFIKNSYGIKRIKNKTWDNRYYGINNLSVQKKESIYEYKKIPDNDEIIDSILIDMNYPGNYSVYLDSLDNNDYNLVKTFNVKMPGRKTIDLINENIVLKKEKFKIKVVYDSNKDIIKRANEAVYVFTNDKSETNEKKFYLYDIYDIVSVHQPLHIKFKSINVDKNDFQFRIKNELNEDITDKFHLKDSYFSNNYGEYIFEMDSNLQLPAKHKEYTLEAIINNQVVASKKIGVNKMYDNFEYGIGTEEDPFIITRASQIELISTKPEYFKYSYKLGCDIDMSGHKHIPIGERNNKFTGTFDGDNYSILNFGDFDDTEDYSYYGFFGMIKNATIKNLKFKNVDIKDNNFSGYPMIGIVSGYARDSVIENIRIEGGRINITRSEGDYGSIIGDIQNSKLYNLSSSANIIINSENVDEGNLNIGGLVGYSVYNYDNNIITKSEFSGKIDYNILSESNVYIGEIVGYAADSISLNNLLVSGKIVLSCQIDEEQCTNNKSTIGYFSGYLRRNLQLKDSIYYLNNDTIEISHDDDNESFNINSYSNVYAITDHDIGNSIRYINKNSEIFKNESTYNLDFDNIWYINPNGPVLRDITLNLIDKSDVIGETNIYNIDYDNLIISNIKSNNGSITKKEFVDDFITFSGDIYTSDNQLVELDNDKIKTGMIVRKNDKDYKIAIKGDVNDDGKVNTLDIIILRRVIAGGYNITLEDYQKKAGDVNEDGKINTIDIIHLRRAIAGGYDDSCQLIWRTCE